MNRQFKRILFCLCSGILFFSMSIGGKAAKPSEKCELIASQRKVTLYTGEKKELYLKKKKEKQIRWLPKSRENIRQIRWMSKNPKIAQVSVNGTVTAKREGIVKIVASLRSDRKTNVSIKVVVKKRPQGQEKECAFSGKLFSGQHYGEEATVLRSREDCLEFLEKAKRSADKNCKREVRNCMNTNFKKDTVVLAGVGRGIDEKTELLGIRMKQDKKGRWYGAIEIKRSDVVPGQAKRELGVSETVMVKLKKKDAVMANYFKVEYL